MTEWKFYRVMHFIWPIWTDMWMTAMTFTITILIISWIWIIICHLRSKVSGIFTFIGGEGIILKWKKNIEILHEWLNHKYLTKLTTVLIIQLEKYDRLVWCPKDWIPIRTALLVFLSWQTIGDPLSWTNWVARLLTQNFLVKLYHLVGFSQERYELFVNLEICNICHLEHFL